jgi:hypothetical protein
MIFDLFRREEGSDEQTMKRSRSAGESQACS